MSQSRVCEHPLADSPPAGAVLPGHDVPSETTYDCCQSPLQPQFVTTRVDEQQADHHALWASTIPASEVSPPSVSGPDETLDFPTSQSFGCPPDRTEVKTEIRPSFHLSGSSENTFESQSDRSSLSSVHFSSDEGAFVPSYNLLQYPVSEITRTIPVPPHLPTRPE